MNEENINHAAQAMASYWLYCEKLVNEADQIQLQLQRGRFAKGLLNTFEEEAAQELAQRKDIGNASDK
jgi:hypothetical protein